MKLKPEDEVKTLPRFLPFGLQPELTLDLGCSDPAAGEVLLDELGPGPVVHLRAALRARVAE